MLYEVITQLDGLGRRMPVTFFAFFLAAMSIIGLPPMGGFISKWMMLMGAVDGKQFILVVVLLFSSLLNAAYFLPIVYRAFINPLPADAGTGMKEAPLFCLLPICVTAIASLALFFYFGTFVQLAQQALGG